MKPQSRLRRRAAFQSTLSAALVSESLESRQLLSATAPQLLSPSTSIETAQPTFTWSAVNGATRYEIWVAPVGQTADPVIHENNLTGTSATFSSSLRDGNYNWWVMAWDNAGNNTGWSDAQQFSVSSSGSTGVAGPPQLLSPSTSIETAQPTFTWSAVNGATRYEIWVAPVGQTADPVIHENNLTGTSATFSSSLRDGNYNWWVMAWDNAGNNTGWSDAQQFSVSSSGSTGVAGPPQLLSPSTSIETAQPTFTWSAVNGATRYEIWVAPVGQTADPVIHENNLTGTSATFSSSLRDGNYNWWVMAWDNAGNNTGWSDAQQFSVSSSGSTGVAGPPQLLSPSTSIETAQPTFTWSAVNGATRYEIWVAPVGQTADPVIHENNLTGTSATFSSSLRDGNYNWWVMAWDNAGNNTGWSDAQQFSIHAAIREDSYEDNDHINQAADLGTLNSPVRIDDLSLADGVDWFTFAMNGTGSSQNYVRVAFDHNQGDIDLRLYDSNGSMLLLSESAGNEELVSLNGLAAGRYYMNVYGFDGATNPSYTLEINPDTGVQSGGGTTSAYNTLYVNFDGIQLSRQDLLRYSQGNWHSTSDYLNQNGVTVNAFRAEDGSRDRIINDIMVQLQQDVNIYGITVQRITGGAVEGHGATTIFVGPTNLAAIQQGAASGVASDVDRGNDNPTDIAIVMEAFPARSHREYVLMVADTILHEAGHTWGLHHVNSNINGSVFGESMGYSYTANHYNLQVSEYPDTEFLDITFHEYIDPQGNDHGYEPGVREVQNSHQVMMAAFGRANVLNMNQSQNLALLELSADGIFNVQASSAADHISVAQLAHGAVELSVNGDRHIVRGLEGIRIFTSGDARDTITIANELVRSVSVIASDFAGEFIEKVSNDVADLWNGMDTVRHVHEHSESPRDENCLERTGVHNSGGKDDDFGNHVDTVSERRKTAHFASDERRRTAAEAADVDVQPFRVAEDDADDDDSESRELTELEVFFAITAETGMDSQLVDLEIFEDLLDTIRV